MMETKIEGAEHVSRVKVFYSSRAQPELLDAYADAFQYLEEAEIDVEIVDIVDDAEKAREHDVVVTPTVVVEEKGDKNRYLGVIDGLRTILEEDIYGRSILHRAGYAEGRTLASNLVLTDTNTDDIAAELAGQMQGDGVEDIDFEDLDQEEHQAIVRVRYAEDVTADARIHRHMAEILGGILTELLQTGMNGYEEECGVNEEAHTCTFTFSAGSEES